MSILVPQKQAFSKAKRIKLLLWAKIRLSKNDVERTEYT